MEKLTGKRSGRVRGKECGVLGGGGEMEREGGEVEIEVKVERLRGKRLGRG